MRFISFTNVTVVLLSILNISASQPLSATCDQNMNYCKLHVNPVDNNYRLTSDATWLLDYELVVKDGGTLIIDAGTLIYASKHASITVKQGGSIRILGTPSEPVKISGIELHDRRTLRIESKDSDQAYFKGISIYGNAPIGTDSRAEEYFPNQGQIETDSSGVIRNLTIERVYEDKKGKAGLSLIGVGNETVFENINISNCANDCLSIKGGLFNISGINLNGAGDDLIDVKYDFIGTLSHITKPETPAADKFISTNHLTTRQDGMKMDDDGNIQSIEFKASKNSE